MFGWTGKVLRINLNENSAASEEFKPEAHLDVLGGRGLAVKIFTSEVKPDTEPLDANNKIVLMTGPLTGTGANSSSYCGVVTKSPLTKGLVCAQLKLHFGAELKAAGYDGIVIEGKAKEPVFLSIQDDDVKLLPARHLQGETTFNKETLIKASFRDPWVAREVKTLCLGPAGESRLPLAGLVTDGFEVDESAGLGAVFGSKNLLAIAVRGTKDILISDGQKFFDAVVSGINEVQKNPYLSTFSKLSDFALYEIAVSKRLIPSCYFIRHYDGSTVELNTITAAWHRSRGCFCCPIDCLKMCGDKDIFPRLEAFVALGPLCGIKDVSLICQAYKKCLETGLDPVETGAFVASVMRLNEMGLLKNVPLKAEFGVAEGYLDLISSLGRGAKTLKTLGQDVASLWANFDVSGFIGVKGKSIVFDIKHCLPLGLNALTHTWPSFCPSVFPVIRNRFETSEVPQEVKTYQDRRAAFESLGICPFLAYEAFGTPLACLKALTGLSWDEAKLLAVGETTVQLEHDFNQKAGIEINYQLPERLQNPELQGILEAYLKLRGWS